MKTRAAIVFAVVGLIWGSAWIPASVVLLQGSRLRSGALRFAMAAVLLGLAALASRLWRLRQNGRTRGDSPLRTALCLPVVSSLILGVTIIGMPYALGVWAAGEVSPGVVATIYAAMPLTALLISGQGSGAEIPGLVIGMGGVAVLVSQGFSTSVEQIKGGGMLAASVALQAWSLVYIKSAFGTRNALGPGNIAGANKVLRGTKLHTSLLGSAAIQFAVAAVLLGVLGIREVPLALDRQTLLSLLLLAVVVSAVTLPLMYWLLERIEPWRVAALQWVAILVAVIEGGWLLRARPTAEMWVGGTAIAATTIWLLQREGWEEARPVTLEITKDVFHDPAGSQSKVD